jgi:hypothetical protein
MLVDPMKLHMINFIRQETHIGSAVTAGAAVFLGLMDLLYDLQHAMFVPLTAEAAIEPIIVLLTLSLGPLITALLWRRRADFIG